MSNNIVTQGNLTLDISGNPGVLTYSVIDPTFMTGAAAVLLAGIPSMAHEGTLWPVIKDPTTNKERESEGGWNNTMVSPKDENKYVAYLDMTGLIPGDYTVLVYIWDKGGNDPNKFIIPFTISGDLKQTHMLTDSFPFGANNIFQANTDIPLVATLLNDKGLPMVGVDVVFNVDGADVGTAPTDSSGVATFQYHPTHGSSYACWYYAYYTGKTGVYGPCRCMEAHFSIDGQD